MNLKIHKKILPLIMIAIFFFTVSVSMAQTLEYKPISEGALQSIGVSQSDISNLPVFLGAIYNFGIAAAVVLTVIMMIWGGIEMMVTESFTGKSAAKEKIQNALVGLLMALLSYIILYTINPCFVDFLGTRGCASKNVLVNPKPITTSNQQGQVPSANLNLATSTANWVGPASRTNPAPCTNCVSATSYGLSCKEGERSCGLSRELGSRLSGVLNKHGAWITEANPQTVEHIDSCHWNGSGSCVDLNFTDRSEDVTRVKNLYRDVVSAGLRAIYENNNCNTYLDAGVNSCKLYPTTTAPNFHVEL